MSMSDMVPMYGFGGGGGTGAKLTVTAPAGAIVTVSKDGKAKTKTAGSDGAAVFKGLETGEWTVTITDGVQISAPQEVTVTADYSIAMTFFSATISVTYPAGSVCTATNGVTTLTAPDTSGVWACVVPNAGTWTVTVVDEGWSYIAEVTENGQTVFVDFVNILLGNGINTLGEPVFYSKAGTASGSNITKGETQNGDGTVDISVKTSSGYWTNTVAIFPVKVSSNHKTLTVSLVCAGISSSTPSDGIIIQLYSDSSATMKIAETTVFMCDSVQLNTLYTVDIDISSVDGCYIAIMFSIGSSSVNPLAVTIKEIKSS